MHSKLRYRIEELEKLQANHSKRLDHHSEQLEHHSEQVDHHSEQLDHHSKKLDHLSKEGEHQGKRLRRHSEELASLNRKVRTEDEEKETYSEFWDKKGINLCRLKHEIFMQIFVRCLVCMRYKKSNSVCVHTHRRTGAKLLGGGVVIFLPENPCAKCSLSSPPPPPPPAPDDECFRK